MWPDLIDKIEADEEIKHKLSYLNTLINVNGLSLENEKDIILVKTKIKLLCTDSTQRTEGLLLLYAVVQANSSIYIENWSQLVLGSLKVADYIISREIPLRILNTMLKNFSHRPEYNVVFSKLIPDILPIILNPEDDRIYKLSCQTLAVCMKYVPKITATCVVDIENLLLRELTNPYGEMIEAIADCFATLPMCILHLQRDRRSGVRYADVWLNLCTKMLSTLDLLLNEIMQLTEDHALYVNVSNRPVLAIPSLEAPDDIPLGVDIFKSLCMCLGRMLSTESAVINISVEKVLKTLMRVFQIEKIIKSRGPITDYLKLGYSQMLNGAYVVLEALILGSQLKSQVNNFVGIMKQSQTVLDEISFSESTVSQVRGSTWKLIDVWLKFGGSEACTEFAKDSSLIAELTSDIEIAEKDILNSTPLNVSDYETNQKANKIYVCTHALKVLRSLIETDNGCILKKDLDDICGRLLRVSSVISRNIQINVFPVPYSSDKCRKLLFDALSSAIYINPADVGYIVKAQNIFKLLGNDPSLKVRRVGHRFKKLSRYYLNPQKPPPLAVQYSPNMLNTMQQQPIIESIRSVWPNGNDFAENQMGDNGVALHEGGNFSKQVDSEGELMTIDDDMNHNYRRISKQSSQSTGGEDSHDDSDEEPTYVSTDSNPQRIVNDSSNVNSFGLQSSVEQYANGTRTDRCASGETVQNKNDIEEHVSAFVEVKSAAQKPPQSAMGNGVWPKTENCVDSSEEESEMEEEVEEEGEAREEADEEGYVNEEVSDNAADEDSDGRLSPDFDDERPSKRQKCLDEDEEEILDGNIDEEADADLEELGEDVEGDNIPANNQSSDEEREVNSMPAVEQNAENPNEEEENQSDSEDAEKKHVDAMCGDFVLVEARELTTPTAETS